MDANLVHPTRLEPDPQKRVAGQQAWHDLVPLEGVATPRCPCRHPPRVNGRDRRRPRVQVDSAP